MSSDSMLPMLGQGLSPLSSENWFEGGQEMSPSKGVRVNEEEEDSE